ncbi:MAG: pyridoxal phosphate-dependent aminotransferase [Lachnospiraceae bacterium]|nr:pyridoxal phosphate-dependent aminotransferase [Lachnospiraceae bacterium]
MEYRNRKNTNCVKWDGLKKEFGEEDLLAMWVADMDFACPDCVTEALKQYMNAPLGYFIPPESYFETVVRWEREHHNYEIEPEWICVTPGVVPAIYWAVRVFTKPEDSVMVSPPVYYPFMHAVEHCEQRKLIKCELKRTGQTYEIDFDRFEEDIVKHNVKLYILCNPHNPIGRVWKREELKRLLDLCKKHHVMVISDEIHQDIINPKLGREKVTAAEVGDYDDMLITMAAASKTFNIAAVQNSFVIIPDKANREKFKQFMENLSLGSGNAFGYIAAEAALRGGEAWLEDVIYGNYEYIRERFKAECPEVKISNLEGTYLMWLDFSAFFDAEEELKEFLQRTCKIAMDYGSWFGAEGYDAFARMNIATSRENVERACDSIICALRERQKAMQQ